VQGGISAAVACDKAQSKALLTALAKDSEKYVAERAQKELAGLEKK